MEFDELILIKIPLVLLAGYILKALFIRKMPPLDDILQWASRSVDFPYGLDAFNSTLDKLLKYNRYTIRQRTKNSVYLIESPLKWKRGGFYFYIVYDESEKHIRIYFKSILYEATQNVKLQRIY